MCRIIPHFHGILPANSCYGVMFVIQSDLQGQWVNFKFNFLKILFLTNTNVNKHHDCVIPIFYMTLTGKSIYGIILVIQGFLQDQEVNSEVEM